MFGSSVASPSNRIGGFSSSPMFDVFPAQAVCQLRCNIAIAVRDWAVTRTGGEGGEGGGGVVSWPVTYLSAKRLVGMSHFA